MLVTPSWAWLGNDFWCLKTAISDIYRRKTEAHRYPQSARGVQKISADTTTFDGTCHPRRSEKANL